LEEQFLGEGVSYHMADIQQGLGIGCSLRLASLSEYPAALLPTELLADCEVRYAMRDSYTSSVGLTKYKSSGFRREVDASCAPLGYYASSSGNFSPTFRDNLSVSSSEIKNYQYSLRNNPEGRSYFTKYDAKRN
jgi:hypothetical protein